MASNQFARKTLIDFLGSFERGMNSGADPLILPKNQLAYASNSTVRGTYVSTRPPWNDITLDFGTDTALQAAVTEGLFQGGCYYKPDTGPESFFAAISGRLFQFLPDFTTLTAQVIERTTGNPQDPTAPQHWLWQAEYFIFWNDGVNLPVFFDGHSNTTSRSGGNVQTPVGVLAGPFAQFVAGPGSVGNVWNLTAPFTGSVVTGTYNVGSFGRISVTAQAANTITFNNIDLPSAFYAPGVPIYEGGTFTPQFPPGRMGCYGLGRVWMALANGRNFIAGDIVGGPSGTPANEFRDAILNITENQYLFGGGLFTVPGAVGDIRAMLFTATLDVSLGQGPLQIFTPTHVFSCAAPVERIQWQSITNPILTESLIANGGLGQNSTIQSNSDTFFRSLDGVRSLVLARREFATWGNVPLSREMSRTIDVDLEENLPYGSAVVFDNRLLMTTHPSFVANRGTVHDGVVVINFDPLSVMGEKAPSVWDGTWPGLKAFQLLTGEFSLKQRCCVFVLTADNKIGLREITKSPTIFKESSQFADNLDELPIFWFFESPAFFNKDVNQDRSYLSLENGEIYVDELRGSVKFEAFYKPDQWPCWIPWHTWIECQNVTGTNDQPQFRPRMGLGTPKKSDCDTSTNRPFPWGYTFQFKLQITGHCRFLGAKFMAVTQPEPTFSKPNCCPVPNG